MALAMYFSPRGFTAAQYDDSIRRLEAAGAGAPDGRLFHAAFGPADGVMVFDVWGSQAQFDAFGRILMPILQEMGVDPGQPMVANVHNIVQG